MAAMNTAMNTGKIQTRLFTTSALDTGVACALNPTQAHKLRAVLRADVGDEILLFNGRDGEWRARLITVDKTRVIAQCLAQVRVQTREPGPWLAFAPLKKERLDQVIEKAVEMGVERLIPVLCQRTQNRRLKAQRLNQQIIDAAQQCERLSIPELSAPVTLEGLAKIWPEKRTLLIAQERANARPLANVLRETGGPLGLLVGPEGGFATRELDVVKNLVISIPISLGPRILRAETAAIAALAVIQALSGDWPETLDQNKK